MPDRVLVTQYVRQTTPAYLSELLDLVATSANDAARLALMYHQSEFRRVVHAVVLLVLSNIKTLKHMELLVRPISSSTYVLKQRYDRKYRFHGRVDFPANQQQSKQLE
jgi:hypothetical protein